MENLRLNNDNNGKENPSSLHIVRLNPVSYIATHDPASRSDFQLAPTKIQKRLMLTDSGWCRMGTFFSPPDDFLSIQELQYLLARMNKINHEAGRPNDADVIIRTASKAGLSALWSEPAFLVENVGTDKQNTKALAGFKDVDYAEAMGKVRKSWKMYHSDNIPLQKKAIHGRLQVNRDELKLDIGSNIPHARALEKGDKTIVHVPIGSVLFFNLDSFVPDDLTVLGSNMTVNQICDFMNNYSSAGRQLGEFINWVSSNVGLRDYVAEFRYYTQNCKPNERFHVMDLDTKF